jgi:hypothetical protein
MFVVGRVLNPTGKPVPNASVMVSARTVPFGQSLNAESRMPTVISHGNADSSGRFRLDTPRMSSPRNDEGLAIALAPGYGAGWVELNPDADQPVDEITLMPEQVIHGRFFDLQGRPVPGVVVSVSSIQRVLIPVSGDVDLLRRTSEGPSYLWSRAHEWPAWPRPATTDAEGRFTLHGLGRGLQVRLDMIHPRFAPQTLTVETDDAPQAKSVTMALVPTKIITGRVTYADTGEPVPKAQIGIATLGPRRQGHGSFTSFETDAAGRFRANPSPGDRFSIGARPPEGLPYLLAHKTIDWPKGAVEQSVNLALPRGVMIRGKITEEVSNRPIANAVLHFAPRRAPGSGAGAAAAGSTTNADGSFEMAVGSPSGHLSVMAPSTDYVVREISRQEYFGDGLGNRRLYSHAFLACNPKPGETSLEVNLALRRGVTVTGHVVGPDDRPVSGAWIFGWGIVWPFSAPVSPWHGYHHRNAVDDRFELHGVDPDTEHPVIFFEPERKLGTIVQLSGKSTTGGSVTVRLHACGTARARLVDKQGRPVVGHHDQYMIAMIVVPGADRFIGDPTNANQPLEDGDFLVRIDSVNYRKEPVSDAQGRIVFPALIPGASYRVMDRSPLQGGGYRTRRLFTVKPGEALDLGDILIEKPEALRIR